MPRNLANWIRRHAIVPTGDGAGQPFKLLPWEKEVAAAVTSHNLDFGISMARGNGKTAFIAALAFAFMDPDSPVFMERTEIVMVASSHGQCKIGFEDTLSMLGEKYDLDNRKYWRKTNTVNASVLVLKDHKTTLKCIGSDPRRAHGLRPRVILADEPAQWLAGLTDRMYAALRTSMGKVPGSRMIALGTRPANEDHWFARLLKRRQSFVYAAAKDDPLWKVSTWRKANPSYSQLPSLRARLRDEARDAKDDVTLQPSFRALRLNLGESDTLESVLLEAGTWKRITGDAPRLGPCVWGVDLGTNAAQSAISAYWPQSGRLEAVACFPDTPSLADRSVADAVGPLYQRCHERGELFVTPGRAADVRVLVRRALNQFGSPASVSSDRWREAELRDAMGDAGVPLARLVLRGMGYRDGAEDVRRFRRACLEGRVTPAPSLLLTAAMGEARVVADTAGNEKLAKAREGGRRASARDDSAAAAILAVAQCAEKQQRTGSRYRGMVQ